MEAAFTCDHDRRRLTVVRTGIITLPELVDTVRRMRTTDIWAYSVLVDARQARTSLSGPEARDLIERITAIGDAADRGPIAVVVADTLVFGMVRMFSTLVESIGMRVNVFHDLTSAESWLDGAAN